MPDAIRKQIARVPFDRDLDGTSQPNRDEERADARTERDNAQRGILKACLRARGSSSIGGCALPNSKTIDPYNIILLTSDQLSADYMRLHGSPYEDTPNLEALAARGTSFTRMYAAAPWTTPSFGVILTGLFPTVHGMTLPPYKGRGGSISQPMAEGKSPKIPSQLLLSSRKPTLPGLLKPYGMITAADNSNRWSIWDVMDRGWDEWKFFPADQLPVAEDHGSDGFYLTAPKTTAWAQQWLTQHQNQRFFLWVHYMEPHAPFNAPDEFNKFHSTENYPNLKDSIDLHRLAKLQNIQAIRRMQELYAGRILYLDNSNLDSAKTATVQSNRNGEVNQCRHEGIFAHSLQA